MAEENDNPAYFREVREEWRRTSLAKLGLTHWPPSPITSSSMRVSAHSRVLTLLDALEAAERSNQAQQHLIDALEWLLEVGFFLRHWWPNVLAGKIEDPERRSAISMDISALHQVALQEAEEARRTLLKSQPRPGRPG